MSTLGIGIVGYGYWGPVLARTIKGISEMKLVSVCEANEKKLGLAFEQNPGIITTKNFSELLTNTSVDMVIIATPALTHFELAQKALQAGKHVLVEKPLCSTVEESQILINLAEKNKLLLMVDHTFLYTSPVEKMKAIVDAGEMGDCYSYDAVRVNLGLMQHDVNILWDLSTHDVSIMNHLIKERPTRVSATGLRYFDGQPEGIAYMSCEFNSKLIAHFHASTLSPIKMRKIILSGTKKLLVYDGLSADEPIRIYTNKVAFNEDSTNILGQLTQQRMGDVVIPQLDNTEALKKELKHFVDCLNLKTKPISGGKEGLEVVAILEAASLSMSKNGTPVEIKYS